MQTQAMIEDVKGIRGLACVPNYLSELEEADLLDLIDHQPWSADLKRRVQHYGYRHNAGRASLSRQGYLPGWLLALAERLRHDGFIGEVPDQCTVHEYLAGQGTPARTDCVPCYGDTVLLLSLGSPSVMEFSHGAALVKIPVLLQPRSLLVFDEAARYRWKHGIAARARDQYDGQIWERGRRVSLTFRKMLVDTSLAASLKYA